MSHTVVPRRVQVSSQKVAQLVFEKIFPVMQGEPEDAMVMSLICAAALVMRPDCPTAKLQDVIMDMSAHLIMRLQDEVPQSEAN